LSVEIVVKSVCLIYLSISTHMCSCAYA